MHVQHACRRCQGRFRQQDEARPHSCNKVFSIFILLCCLLAVLPQRSELQEFRLQQGPTGRTLYHGLSNDIGFFRLPLELLTACSKCFKNRKRALKLLKRSPGEGGGGAGIQLLPAHPCWTDCDRATLNLVQERTCSVRQLCSSGPCSASALAISCGRSGLRSKEAVQGDVKRAPPGSCTPVIHLGPAAGRKPHHSGKCSLILRPLQYKREGSAAYNHSKACFAPQLH